MCHSFLIRSLQNIQILKSCHNINFCLSSIQSTKTEARSQVTHINGALLCWMVNNSYWYATNTTQTCHYFNNQHGKLSFVQIYLCCRKSIDSFMEKFSASNIECNMLHNAAMV